MKLSLEYAAGLFDGEGYVGLVKGDANKNGKPNYVLKAQVTNTCLSVITAFQETFGGRIYLNCLAEDHFRPAWTLVFTSHAAVEFLRKIEPFLFIKRNRAKLSIRVFEEYLGGKYRGPRGIPPEFRARLNHAHGILSRSKHWKRKAA